MRSIGDLMKELGFNEDSSLDAKKAFIKNLVKAAEAVAPAPTPIHVGSPLPKAEKPLSDLPRYVSTKKAKNPAAVQLEFVFSTDDDSKKVS